MKSIVALLNLLICFELIVAPVAPQLSLIGSKKAIAQDACDPGLVWNTTLKRCVATDQAARAMNHSAQCADASLYPTDADRARCYRDFAEQEKTANDGENKLLGEASSTFDGMQVTSTIVQGVGVALVWAVLINAWKSGSKVDMNKCAAISYVALTAGILALMGGDALANFQHGSRLNDIEAGWQKIVDPESAGITDRDQARAASTEAQKQAFYVLAEQEQSLADAFQMKTYFYGGAAVAFGIAFGLSAYEQWSTSGNAWCNSSGEESGESPAPAKVEGSESAGDLDQGAPQNKLDGVDPGATPSPIPEAPSATAKNESLGGGNGGGAREAVSSFSGQGIVSYLPKVKTVVKPFAVWKPYSEAGTDWEVELMKQKHAMNIESAVDMASFYVLSKAHQYKNSSPTIEDYDSIKTYTTATQMDANMEPEGFQFLKMAARTILGNITPIPSAKAQDSLSSSSSSSSSTGAPADENLDCSDEKLKNATNHERAQCGANWQNNYSHIALWTSLGSGLAIGSLVGGLAGPGFGKAMISPTGRMITSGVLIGWAVAMIIWLQIQKGNAEKRRDLLKKMGDDFAAAAGTIAECKSEDRKDPGKPNCYCYTPEGERNSNRANSKICQELWNGNLDFSSGDYTADGKPRGCIDSNGQPDPKCACRKSSRKCLKATPSNLNGVNLGSFRMLATGLTHVDKLGDNTLDTNKVSGTSLAQQAMRIMRANKKLLKDPKFKNIAAKVNSQIKATSAKVSAEIAKMPPPTPSVPPTNPAAAIATLEKEIKENKEKMQGAQKSAPGGGGKPSLEFGMTEEDLAAQGGQVAEAMKQDLNFGENDISSGRNIFEVLSNRYQKSGMRRLFDDEGKTKAEKPAESDIVK